MIVNPNSGRPFLWQWSCSNWLIRSLMLFLSCLLSLLPRPWLMPLNQREFTTLSLNWTNFHSSTQSMNICGAISRSKMRWDWNSNSCPNPSHWQKMLRDVDTIQFDENNTVSSLRHKLDALRKSGNDDEGFPILKKDFTEDGSRMIGYIGASELEHALSKSFFPWSCLLFLRIMAHSCHRGCRYGQRNPIPRELYPKYDGIFNVIG